MTDGISIVARGIPSYAPTGRVTPVIDEVMERADKDLLNGDYYFRLNVPQGMSTIGLDEWNKMEDMTALTISYIQRPGRVKPELNITKLLRRPQVASISNS